MLAQVLQPGFHEKGLDHPSLLGGILEYTPGIGAIAPALLTKLFERAKKRFPAARIDPVFDRDQHRAAIVPDLIGNERCRPMQGWCQVDPRAGLQLPAPCQRNRDEGPGGGHEMRRRQAQHPCDLSPDDAAEGKRTEENRHEESEPTPPPPSR